MERRQMSREREGERPDVDEESTADENDRQTKVAGVRREKTRAKTAFTKAWRALLSAIANSYTPSEINGLTAELDDQMMDVLEVMEWLASLLELHSNDLADEKVGDEMEKIEEEYSSAQNRAAECCE